MRFSKVGIIGTLMAVAAALLVILPILATDGTRTLRGTNTASAASKVLTVKVYAHGDIAASEVQLTDDTVTTDARDTRDGVTLYVSNSSAAFDTILVIVIDTSTVDANKNAGAGNDTITVTVKNDDSGAKILRAFPQANSSKDGELVLNEASPAAGKAATEGVFQGIIRVIDLAVSGATAEADIAALDSHKILITYQTVTIAVIVDSKGPVIGDLSPVHEEITKKDNVVISATITDSGSGMRADAQGEGKDSRDGSLSGDGDHDSDGVTAEPATEATGKSFDVGIMVNTGILTTATVTSDGRIAGSNNESAQASAGWTAVTDGFKFSYTRSGLDNDGNVFWNVVAIDRAGNKAVTDSDLSEDGGGVTADEDQAFLLVIDGTDPSMGLVETGLAWDSAKKKQKSSRKANSIKVTFTNGGATPVGNDPDDVGYNGDPLNPATVQASDFTVEGHSIKSITHPNLKKSTTGDNPTSDFRNIVYITLTDNLDADEEPDVNVVGNIEDLAGNDADIESVEAKDNIRPKLTVTITGTLSGGDEDRPITKGDKTENRIVVRVTADEPLKAPPTIDFQRYGLATVTVDVSGEDDKEFRALAVTSFTAVTPTLVSGQTQTWETKQLNTIVGSGEGLVGIFVYGTDVNEVDGSSGTGGDRATGSTTSDLEDRRVDLAKANLFEFDPEDLAAADIPDLSPDTGNNAETESKRPFIKIDFNEGKEYKIGGNAHGSTQLSAEDDFQCGPADGDLDADDICQPKKRSKTAPDVGSSPTKYEIDTYDKVTLTSITLDGVDVSNLVGKVDKDSFVLALSDLSVGVHVLAFNGVDLLGNTFDEDQEFSFEVKKRSKYEIDLFPGWNLISLPGTPVDPAIDSVLPDDHPATTVLAFENGEWKTATRGADGSWEGTITEIDANHGYWINTTAFDELEALIPERDPTTQIPTIAVIAGWNLVPIVDLTQADAGDPPGGDNDGDGTIEEDCTDPNNDCVTGNAYFASIGWSVAYGYDTETNTWEKLSETPSRGNVFNGKGYWVWVTKKGTLVP